MSHPSHSMFPRDPTPACVASSSDIASLGVRVATYFQSLLLFVTTFIFVFDGFVDSGEQKVLNRIYKSLLLMACGLLLSAVVHATRFDLSVYHAFVVLNLCWMLVANALIVCVLPTIDAQIQRGWRGWIGSFWPSRVGQLRAVLLVSIHLSALGAVGLWLWSNPINFSESVQCTRSAIVYVFVTPLSLTDRSLRITSLVFYGLAVVPVLNTLIFTAIVVTVVKVINGLIPRPYTFGRLYRIAACVQAIVNAFLIASTELTVRRNRGLVDGGSSDWGFGQILVLLLGISPILAAVEVVTRKFSRMSWKSRLDYWVWRFLRKSADPWDGLYKKASECLASVLEFLKSSDGPPDSAESSAIKHSLRTSQALLAAANKTIRSSNAHNEKNTEDYVVTIVTPTVSIGAAASEVGRIHERISAACDLRFPDIQGAMSALIARGYLEAAKDALGATKGALDAYRVAVQR